MNDADVISQALSLPLRNRERVAEALFESIKRPSQKHLDKLWSVEAEGRIDGILAGKIRTISGERVLAYRAKK